ncbi:MAG: response regulator [Oligoflexia bacterium]|nr:response regulator [Oligoflexia bacterium]
MPGTRFSDFILPFSILILTLTISLAALRIFRDQELSSSLIDIAGRQRMLLQRHSREIEFGIPGEERAWGTLQELSEAASTLRHGGQLKFSDDPPLVIRVTPASDPQIQAKLEEQIRILADLERLSGKPFGSQGFVLMERAIQNANETTHLFVEASQERSRKLLLAVMGLTLALGSLGMWLNRLIVERGIRMQQLLAAKETAVRASEAKTQFLANLSHEIRTPLNAIIGMTDILHETKLSREQTRFVDTLRRAGETLLALINDILDLSKIESGRAELQAEEVELSELIDRIGEIMALRAHQKGLELTCYIAPDVPSHVLTDSNGLRQVLVNLLGNAVKFTASGEISLRVERAGEDSEPTLVRFSVSDTGIGIAENRFEAIFESFSQADPSIAMNYGGTGLGLAISKRIVEAMDGKLTVQSRLGVGSVFEFTIPLQPNPKAQIPALPEVPTGTRRILVVDDNDTNRFIVRRYLDGSAATVVEARDGNEALKLLREASSQARPFDLILLDYRMPEVNGLDVAEAIQAERLARGAIVMLLTSDGRRVDLPRLSELGISEYLVKPVRKTELLRALSAASSVAGAGPRGTAHPPAEGATAPSLSGRKVLLVDDVEDNRFVLASYLASTGALTDEARSGEEAITKARQTPFDLILMDMRMNPIDGYAATEAIRRAELAKGSGRATIIAVTAHALKEDIERALAAGCDAHLLKPVSRAKLFETLSRLLRVPESPIQLEVEDFVRPRLAAYVKNRISDLAVLRDALTAKDFARLMTIGHNTAGTAGIYGMTELTDLAAQLEQSAKRGDITAVAALIERMEGYLTRVTALV